ncbi:TRAP transporter large permease [Candidatus Pelagibacter sp. HIMB1321]|uniref:TRAP transporter large permease n=1 Tax=Candidatus Pelagibacter sp. HIMB1321 TaxID=1388755 RepID=UPI000A081C25|nr:TRAP transporter large permease subunit [Candidatus Pelagibacter sp. HIMB1321]SMF73485.1 TRAP transporter, DctM subunit [Candidatus Pelagibacter sp. HIMB1321]
MENLVLTVIFLFTLFFLLGSGVWIGLSLMGVAYVGLELFTNRPAGDAMITTIWSSASSWSLTALPLFIWMGEILYRTRLSEDLFKGLAPWMNNLPGRLLHTNIVGCTFFAAVSGSSAATLTTVGKMSVPELRKRKYPENLTIGTLAGSSTLGLMIPPSLTLIVYGVTINESVVQLFMAGILPGLVLALLFMGYVAVWATINRKKMPKKDPEITFMDKIKSSKFLFPIFSLIIFVIGSMYMGWATPTEAAGFGVIGGLVLAALQRSLTWKTFFDSLIGATKTSCMIAFILMGGAFLTLSMGFTGLPRSIAEWIANLGLTNLELLLYLMIFYIILGCFLDGISSIVLTMAVVEPMIRNAGIDVIWFGIYLTVLVEMAQITPPVGFNLFVLQGMTKHEMIFLAKSALPMFLMMVVMVFIMIAFPELATYLPSTVKGPGAG